MDFKN